MDEHLRKIRVDSPATFLVRDREGVARNLPANSQVIELLWHRAQTRFDVAQTLPASKLGKHHAEKLIPTGERADSVIAVVAGDATPDSCLGTWSMSCEISSVLRARGRPLCENKRTTTRRGAGEFRLIAATDACNAMQFFPLDEFYLGFQEFLGIEIDNGRTYP